MSIRFSERACLKTNSEGHLTFTPKFYTFAVAHTFIHTDENTHTQFTYTSITKVHLYEYHTYIHIQALRTMEVGAHRRLQNILLNCSHRGLMT